MQPQKPSSIRSIVKPHLSEKMLIHKHCHHSSVNKLRGSVSVMAWPCHTWVNMLACENLQGHRESTAEGGSLVLRRARPRTTATHLVLWFTYSVSPPFPLSHNDLTSVSLFVCPHPPPPCFLVGQQVRANTCHRTRWTTFWTRQTRSVPGCCWERSFADYPEGCFLWGQQENEIPERETQRWRKWEIGCDNQGPLLLDHWEIKHSFNLLILVFLSDV